MPLRRPTSVLAATAVLGGLLTTPAAASAAPDHALPFACAEEWTGTTRPTHRPGPDAIDFNRPADLGRIVVASAPGVVARVEDTGSRSYGKWVSLTHAEGHSTLYAHLKAQWVVPGQFVDQGAPLGRVGDSGGVTGAHLHYEQRLGGTLQPPTFQQQPFGYGLTTASGNCPDVPLAGDWDGDRAHEVAVFRRAAGVGTFELYSTEAEPTAIRLGWASDAPVVGDWDGDGATDVGVRRPGARVFLLRTADGVVTRKRFGLIRDVPVTGDWDGDGATDVGIWRPAAARFRLLRADGTQQVVALGSRTSQPVTGDWDGDGVTDLGVFDAATATFSLRTVSSSGEVTVTSVPLGTATDLPVTGDWDGDGVTDVGTWTPGTAMFTMRVTPRSAPRRAASAAPEIRMQTFGRPR